MFCRISEGKKGFTLYACERYREQGKVKAINIKIGSYNWCSLYSPEEIKGGLNSELPEPLLIILNIDCNSYNLNMEEVVKKLKVVKKNNYTTYKEQYIKSAKEIKIQEYKKEQKEKEEYNNFKIRYKTLFEQDLNLRFESGRMYGQMESKLNNDNSNVNIDKSQLKKLYKKMAFTLHPDRNQEEDTTELMVILNELKNQWGI